MTSPLDNLAATGSLQRERPDRAEYEGLPRSGRVRLADAARPVDSLESRFDLAYNAAHTLGLGPEVWRTLATGDRIRNQGEYEGDLDVDERLVTDLVAAAAMVLHALDALPPPA